MNAKAKADMDASNFMEGALDYGCERAVDIAGGLRTCATAREFRELLARELSRAFISGAIATLDTVQTHVFAKAREVSEARDKREGGEA